MKYLIGAFRPPCHLSFTFVDERNRKHVLLKKENGQVEMVPLFQSQENIVGDVIINPIQGKKVEHTGVKIELLGQIELYNDRGNFYDFISLVPKLKVPGDIYERKTYRFEFSIVEMPYESYNGVNVRLSIRMEVGIEDCLHIKFEYNKSKYHLKDAIIGKIYFMLVRVKIKNMELESRRRESAGSGANKYIETETLAKFELMDGAPVRGESIPFLTFSEPLQNNTHFLQHQQ
ncbi:hypothetical protein GIB67_029402 [Kingdonia uniflora]|uniref:Uncharacterized protein n=1 Tax=Kingdonia uniflora TaxID=39325 RepID=A0A7J7NYG8_9MAGN|nr:hypothetical protein GIB67_029402 [Kingdonia uniflora]